MTGSYELEYPPMGIAGKLPELVDGAVDRGRCKFRGADAGGRGLARRVCYLLAAAILTACAHQPPPPPKSWDSLPVRLALSADLSDCQIQAAHLAVAQLEAWAGRDLFTLELVPADSLDALGQPRRYTVAVTPDATTSPDSRADTDVFADADGRIHSAVVHLGSHCSVWVTAHEAGHSLGLVDVFDPDNQMHFEYAPYATATLTDEQRTAVLIGTVTRIARKEPGSKATTVRAVGGEGL